MHQSCVQPIEGISMCVSRWEAVRWQSWIFWAYSQNTVRTNEIAGFFQLLRRTSLTVVKVCLSTWVFEHFWVGVAQMLLGYTSHKNTFNSPRNLTWFTRPLFFLRGWGMGMVLCWHTQLQLKGKPYDFVRKQSGEWGSMNAFHPLTEVCRMGSLHNHS